MDGRRKRRERSLARFKEALKRLTDVRPLKRNGGSVGVTKEALWREAGSSSATLYRTLQRYPEFASAVERAVNKSQSMTARSAMTRERLAMENAKLRSQSDKLLAENNRLMELLASHGIMDRRPSKILDFARRNDKR